MKKLLSILLVAGAVALASCGSNNKGTDEKEKKVNQDSITSAQKEKDNVLAKLRNDIGNDGEDANDYFYMDKTSPSYMSINKDGLFLELARGDNNSPILKLTIQCMQITGSAGGYGNIVSLTIITDKETYSLDENYLYDGKPGSFRMPMKNVDQKLYDILKDIINSKSVKIKFSGNKKSSEILIADTQKQALQNVIDGYHVLGGDMK